MESINNVATQQEWDSSAWQGSSQWQEYSPMHSLNVLQKSPLKDNKKAK